MKRTISLLLAVLMCCGLMFPAVQPTAKAADDLHKISPYLLNYMQTLPDDAGVPIGILPAGPSNAEIEAMIPISDPSDRNTMEYWSAKRRLKHKINTEITTKFVQNYLDENDMIYYYGYIRCITVMVPKEKVFRLAQLDEVVHIDLVSEWDAPVEATGSNDAEADTVVTMPTCTEPGFTTYTCAICGESSRYNEVPALGHDYADGVCIRCGAEDPDYVPPVADPFRFDDVKDDKAFYFAPVYWAVEKKITKGTSEKLFSPDEGCTRAQVVTFLWRAAGDPEPQKTENPFKDVKESAYYCKAVAWAVEKGITKGTSADKFSPDATCTRAQIVTFLYRAEGTPEIVKKSKLFHDVADGQYYADAVAWAVENKITRGKSADVFSPDATCTRGEVVTFLFRAMGGK